MNDQQSLSKTAVPEASRVNLTSTLFGMDFPLRLEPCIFTIARRLSPDYNGGYWKFYRLGNGGFYMAPECSNPLEVTADNGYCGLMSPDAFGITVCLYAYSSLSFSGDAFAVLCAEHYHHLRRYALRHVEVDDIMAATD